MQYSSVVFAANSQLDLSLAVHMRFNCALAFSSVQSTPQLKACVHPLFWSYLYFVLPFFYSLFISFCQYEMTDPLSIAASLVGITVPALHGVRLLSEDLQQLKEAPKTVKRLSEDVQSVETSLKLLQGVGEREWDLLGASVLDKSKATISSCTQACNLFRTDPFITGLDTRKAGN
jgi:hypothetical protein